MKKIFYFAASALMMCSCADSFLSEEPVGEFLPGQVESEENIEGIVTGAYACLLYTSISSIGSDSNY